MSGADRMKNKLTSWIGYSEKNGKAQKYIIKPYNKLTGRSLTVKTPWCQIGVVSAMYQSKAVSSYTKTSGCKQAVSWYRKHKRFRSGKVTPRLLDQIFYDFKGKGSPTHTGVIVKIDTKKHIATAIECNKSDAVGYRRYNYLTYKYVYGYGTPAYKK